ncbi:MAG: hypothetical protein JW959_14400 [Pirellulales bacterium]|nr:hypothetical protein [Pirellulales bacterium]
MPIYLRLVASVFSIVACVIWAAACRAVEYPGPAPGEARAAIQSNLLSLQNDALAARWRIEDGHLLPDGVEDKQANSKIPPGGELFELALSEGETVKASEMTLIGDPRVETIPADNDALRAGDRFAGKQLSAVLADKDGKLRVRWRAVLRDGANYVRQEIVVHARSEDFPLKEIVALDLPAEKANQVGETLGSPVVSGNMFFACESPLADNEGSDGRVRCRLKFIDAERRNAVVPKQSLGTRSPDLFSCWSVVGVAPPGQMRRAFLCHVERERPRPYRPFLHYNCYYDISWACRKFDERQALEAIESFGRELIEKRGVEMDSFVFDNGWDDPSTLWGFHEGFPRGFAPLREAAEKYRSTIGAWLSPCGGGGPLGEQRREFGRRRGFELNAHGLSPAGPKYFDRFREVCLGMIEKFGANTFKFDDFGIGNTALGKPYRRPTPEEAADIEAMTRLIADLRKARPDIYINTTVGTWPSPFWLWHGDNIWRNDRDMGFHGAGSMRQQWITYRDAVVQEMIARRAPLYPLNSLITQGITIGRLGTATRMAGDLKDIKDEIRMFFASGTQLQELYISPGMMSSETWDALAEAALWTRANADVLVDTHFVGGDASKAEVYGYASWSPRKGIVALRNPSGKPAAFALNLEKAFELPPNAPRKYSLKSPWKEDAGRATISTAADGELPIRLRPFEVLVLEAAANDAK